MRSLLFEELLTLDDVEINEPGDGSAFELLKAEYNIILPQDHQALLLRTNGIGAYAGYVRLFGVNTISAVDAIRWNQYDFWKFAWGRRCLEYWCFGETAWGDQYAYVSESVRSGQDAEVYFLDAFSMTPKVVASSFAEFFNGEFLRSARGPLDEVTLQVRRKLGPLEISSHVNYVPSIVLGGTEDVRHVHKMNARAGMICNGDIALQVEAAPDEAVVGELQPYEDELHRGRLRLLWR